MVAINNQLIRGEPNTEFFWAAVGKGNSPSKNDHDHEVTLILRRKSTGGHFNILF